MLLKVAAGVIAGLAILLGVQTWRVDGLQDKLADNALSAEKTQNQILLALADKQAKLNELSSKAQEIQANADEEHAKLIADVRSGQRKLRERFTCPRASDSEGSSGSDDAGSRGLRTEDAEFLIGEAKRADDIARDLTLAQKVIREYEALLEKMRK